MHPLGLKARGGIGPVYTMIEAVQVTSSRDRIFDLFLKISLLHIAEDNKSFLRVDNPYLNRGHLRCPNTKE